MQKKTQLVTAIGAVAGVSFAAGAVAACVDADAAEAEEDGATT